MMNKILNLILMTVLPIMSARAERYPFMELGSKFSIGKGALYMYIMI